MNTNVIVISRPNVDLKGMLNKSAYVAGCIVGTTKRCAKVSGAIIKHDYKEMMFNLKNS